MKTSHAAWDAIRAIETPITVTFPRERHQSQYREPKPGVAATPGPRYRVCGKQRVIE